MYQFLLEFKSGDLARMSFRRPTEDYKITYNGFDRTDNTVQFQTGDYLQTIQFVKTPWKFGMLSRASFQDAMSSDLNVFCDCADFKFTFQYVADKKGFGFKPQSIPAVIRNPSNKGTVCKHLKYLLNNWKSLRIEMYYDILNHYSPADDVISKYLKGQQLKDII